MTLYTNQEGKLKEVKEKPFRLEKDIQRIFEANIEEIMGIELVKSEFTIKNRRIDTLAYDKQSQAFTIIEYKRDKNMSVFDQGITYLNLMLQNKADFIVEYNESLKGNLKREDVDWSQTRVAFVSTSFTEIQVQAADFKDFAIELWEVKQYENNTIAINQIKKSASAESIKPLTQKNETLKNVTEEIKVYTEQDYLKKASEYTAELYERFKTAILNLDSGIEVNPTKVYIGFKKRKIIAYFIIQKKDIKIVLTARKGQLDDPKKIAKDVSQITHWGQNGAYQINVQDDKDLEYIMSLIKQVINE